MQIISYIITVVMQLLLQALYFVVGYYPPNSNVFGSARLMSKLRRLQILSRYHKGLIIEDKKRISKQRSFTHLLLVGGTGWGKSSRLVLPNLLNPPKEKPSFVVTDPSHELYNNAAGYLSSIGYTVKKLDFSSADHTFGFNPLADIATDSDRHIERIADILVRSSFSSSDQQAFWNDKAKEVLTLFIRCLLHPSIDAKYQNLGNVRYLLNGFGSDGKSLNSFFKRTCNAFLENELKGFLAENPNVRQSAISTAKASLKLFTSQDICRITASNSIDFKQVRKTPVALFVGIPEQEEQLFMPLLNVFYTQLFYFLMQTPKLSEKDVYVLLDEGGNLTLPSFAKWITVLRKRRVCVSLIVQSLSQIEAKYGKEKTTIIHNLSNQIYAPGMPLATAQMLEQLLGRATVAYRQPANSNWEVRQKNRQYVGRNLFTVDELRRLPYPLFVTGNESATLLKQMHPYFNDFWLKKRAAIQTPQWQFDPLPPCEFLRF